MYVVNKVMLTKLQMTKEPPVLSLQNLNWHTVTRLSYLLYDAPCSWHNIKLLVIIVPNKRELIFFLPHHENMLPVLFRSASAWHF